MIKPPAFCRNCEAPVPHGIEGTLCAACVGMGDGPADTGKARRVEVRRQLTVALQSPWEPACIARAFATPRPGEMVFTMQVWIDLDRARSPLLMGRPPEEPDELDAAFAAFGAGDWAEIEPERAVRMMAAALEAIDEGWSAALKMEPLEGSTAGEPDGFGGFAPLLEALIATAQTRRESARGLGLSLGEALRLRVSAAHILLATHRRAAGWKAQGTPYALRETPNTKPQSPSANDAAGAGEPLISGACDLELPTGGSV